MGKKGEERMLEDFVAGLAHVDRNLACFIKDETRTLELIRTQVGSKKHCMSELSRQAVAAAMVAWFRDKDLLKCKHAAFVATKIDRLLRQLDQDWLTGSPVAFGLFWPMCLLLSDHEELIQWYAAFDWYAGWDGDQPRPKWISQRNYEDLYCGYQTTLALRGEWSRVGERSERWLDAPPARLKRFIPDMRFFLALAKGDVAGMEQALAEIVSPKQRRLREHWHGGYTHRLVSEEAVAYAKIAWRNGYRVDVDTPYIPREWLPVSPLPEYSDPYDFMQGFDIWQPLPARGSERP
jgi:hypothetical protein